MRFRVGDALGLRRIDEPTDDGTASSGRSRISLRERFCAKRDPLAQDAPSACQQIRNKVELGTRWKSWTPAQRELYLEGFRDGESHTFVRTVISSDMPASRKERLRVATALFYEGHVLASVMTDFYRDPANTYIPFRRWSTSPVTS